MEDKRFEVISLVFINVSSVSINVSSKASVRPNHSPQCLERLQPDQPRTCYWTWLRMPRLVAMVIVMRMKWSKDHLFPRSRTDLRGILPPYASKKRWVFLDSFGYGWGSQLEALPKWLQAKFAGTTKLNPYQVHGTYKLSWYHFISIIKLRLLGTSTPFSGTSSLSQTSPHKCSSGNTQLYDGYLIGSLLAKHIPSHSCVSSAICSEPSQPTKTSTRPETWGPTRPEDIKVLRC